MMNGLFDDASVWFRDLRVTAKKPIRFPRGYRLNNPGNVRHGDPWQGRTDDQPDEDFVQFVSPKYGIRAMAKVLLTYQHKHFLRTVREIIGRWAPTSENDTESYIQAVLKETKFQPGLSLDLFKMRYAKPLVKAIIRHENGATPKGWVHGNAWYDDATITAGLKAAGIK